MGVMLTTMSDLGINGFAALAVLVGFMLFVSWVASQGEGEMVEVPQPVPRRDRR